MPFTSSLLCPDLVTNAHSLSVWLSSSAKIVILILCNQSFVFPPSWTHSSLILDLCFYLFHSWYLIGNCPMLVLGFAQPTDLLGLPLCEVLSLPEPLMAVDRQEKTAMLWKCLCTCSGQNLSLLTRSKLKYWSWLQIILHWLQDSNKKCKCTHTPKLTN